MVSHYEPEMITISLDEYEGLKEAAGWADCLDQAGVDNWEGCEYAQELYREQYGHLQD